MIEVVKDKLDIKIPKYIKIGFIIIIIFSILSIIYYNYDQPTTPNIDKQYLDLFKSDDEFYNKLIQMDPDYRKNYLKSLSAILDNNPDKSSELMQDVKIAIIAGGVSELLKSGHVYTMLYTGMIGGFIAGLSNIIK